MKKKFNLIRVLHWALIYLISGGLLLTLILYLYGFPEPAAITLLYSLLLIFALFIKKKNQGIPSLIIAIFSSGLVSTLESYYTGRAVMWSIMYFAVFFTILFFTPKNQKRLIVLESAIMLPLAVLAVYFTLFHEPVYQIPSPASEIIFLIMATLSFGIIAGGVILGKSAMERSMQKLDEKRNILNALFESSPNPNFVISPGLRIISFNRAAREFIEAHYPIELNKGQRLSDIIPPDDFSQLMAEVKKCTNDEEVSFEVSYKKGQERQWFEVSLMQVHGRNDRLWGINVNLHDITERKQIREEIEKLALVASEINTAVIISDRDNKIEWVNDYFTEISGYEASEVIGKDPTFLHGPGTSKSEVARINELLEKGQALRSELVNYHKDGHPYWIDLIVKPILDNEGKVLKYFSVHNEISRIKEREAELERSERLLNRMEKTAHIGAWEWNTVSKEFFTTREIKRILNRKEEDSISLEEFLGLIATKSGKDASELLSKYIYSHEDFDEVVLFHEKNGKTMHIRIIGRKTIGPDGIKRMYGVFQDVSASIASEIKLRESKALIEGINKNLQDGIYRSTIDRGMIYANEAFAQIFGYRNVEEIFQSDVVSFYKNEKDRVHFLDLIDRDGYVKNFEVELKRKNGEIFWGEISASISKDNQGEPVIDGLVRDITILKEAQLALIAAKEKAEKASMAKAEFLSVMSHEIRTPMNAVIGMTELMLMENPREDQMEYLQTLKFSAGNLLNIINDILDFSKIDAGKIEFEKVQFPLNDMFKSLMSGVRPRIGKKNVQICLEADPKMPKNVIGDPTRLSQVLNNLLSNAAKFTEEGSITLGTKVLSQNEKESLIRFFVRDTGIGIHEDKQEEIFKSFAQADASVTRKYGGTGLGLAITKRLLELQGSEIKLKSMAGEGSEFFFDMTFELPEPVINGKAILAGDDKETAKDLSGMRILIVEDNIINQKLAERFLQKWNADTKIAQNGKEALEMIRKEDNAYDAVLMDLQMPVMDGYTATKEIRMFNNDLPILALTASAMLEIQERVMASGMNDYITKPINPMELNHKLYKYKKA